MDASAPLQANLLGALALSIADRVEAAADSAAGQADPVPAALALIGHEPGISIEMLRHGVGLSHSATVRLVDRLTTLALVERRASQRDARAVALQLTPSGKAVASEIRRLRNDSIEAALQALTPHERVKLTELSAKLLRALTGGVPDALRTCRLCDPEVCDPCPVDAALRAID